MVQMSRNAYCRMRCATVEQHTSPCRSMSWQSSDRYAGALPRIDTGRAGQRPWIGLVVAESAWRDHGAAHLLQVALRRSGRDAAAHPTRPTASSSSSSSLGGASLAGHSCLHEFTPLGTVLRTLPRRVEAEIVLLEVELDRSKPGSSWSTR